MRKKKMDRYVQWSEDLYQFVTDVTEHMRMTHDYGSGDVLNMVEMHTLSLIAEQPGISVGQVARHWKRTMSAASRNVDRLVSKGYVSKQKLDGNEKTVHLFPTEDGRRVAELHRAYDEKELRRFADYMGKQCSLEDMENFDRVMLLVRTFFLQSDMEERQRRARRPAETDNTEND